MNAPLIRLRNSLLSRMNVVIRRTGIRRSLKNGIVLRTKRRSKNRSYNVRKIVCRILPLLVNSKVTLDTHHKVTPKKAFILANPTRMYPLESGLVMRHSYKV